MNATPHICYQRTGPGLLHNIESIYTEGGKATMLTSVYRFKPANRIRWRHAAANYSSRMNLTERR